MDPPSPSLNAENKQDLPPEMRKVHICCSESPFFFVKYIVLVLISIILLFFCMAQIIRFPDSPNTIYFSLISMVVGLFVPSPSSKK